MVRAISNGEKQRKEYRGVRKCHRPEKKAAAKKSEKKKTPALKDD